MKILESEGAPVPKTPEEIAVEDELRAEAKLPGKLLKLDQEHTVGRVHTIDQPGSETHRIAQSWGVTVKARPDAQPLVEPNSKEARIIREKRNELLRIPISSVDEDLSRMAKMRRDTTRRRK
jgi:hypothetical protein